MKNNYWHVTPNPWITGLQCCNYISPSIYKYISPCSITVFSLYHKIGKWPPEIQKIIIKWDWFSDGSDLLVFYHFECFYNGLHHERCKRTPCLISEFSGNYIFQRIDLDKTHLCRYYSGVTMIEELSKAAFMYLVLNFLYNSIFY